MFEASIESEDLTFEVTLANRQFPSLSQAYRSPPLNRIRTLLQQPHEAQLAKQLSHAISQRLAWQVSSASGVTDRETVATAYISSLKTLNECYNEIRTVVLEACRANLEFRANDNKTHTEARDAVLSGKLDEMMTQAFAAWLPAKNSLTASLLSSSPDVVVEKLNASLVDEVASFSRQFVELLNRMVDMELFGLVEWLPNQCCCYHFFRRVVIQGAEVRTQSIQDSFDKDSDPDFIRRPAGNRRTTSTRTVKHEIRFARHQHELINAVRTSVRNSTVIMPPQIVRLVDSIPEWLYPFVEVIDGQIVRELIIERDVSVEDWTKVDVRDEPIMDIDPGIVIGPCVLSGWGSLEIRKEQERRQAIEDVRTDRSNRRVEPVLIVAATGLSGIALGFQYHSAQGHGNLLFVMATTGTAIVAAWQAFLTHAAVNRFAAPKHYAHCMAISAATVLMAAEWGVARIFHSMSWVTPIVLGATAVLGFQIGRLFR
jgi:hypothetical protein